MLKNISNLGKTLNKFEQQSINGGNNDCHLLPTTPCNEGFYRDENCICVPGGPF
ncbi:hypothetical protein [Tenacibaculum aiptasiae]|uniref:hypothetical protein n=1 Tax=Tenacibaculum aiptasiae TaxID=426481 RepID=UPI00232DB52B|nr:hypothetical protein [Tenacibaculum aiptasiae]